MLERILDFVLPPRCGGCLRLGTWYCPRCWRLTRRLEEPTCSRCGRELPSRGAHCGCRLRHVRRIESAAALEGPLEAALHRFKYSGWRELARPLSSLLVTRVARAALPARLAVAVPLHAERLRSRGFNQSELLVTQLRRRLPLADPPGRLVRSRASPPQVGLDRLRRLSNLRSAFAWEGEVLRGEPVIVIDDVSTTGATIDACAEALKAGGAGLVYGFTVARVGF